MKNKAGKKKNVSKKVDEESIARIMNSGTLESDDEDFEDGDLDVSSGDDENEVMDFGSEGDSEDNGSEIDDEETVEGNGNAAQLEGNADSDEESAGEEDHVQRGADIDSEEGDSDDDVGTSKQHKSTLKKLKNTDPTFYKFLLENDKDLLNFEDSDSDLDEDNKLHKPPEQLERDSDDDSDYEAEEEYTGDRINVTNQMIEDWADNLQTEGSLEVIADVVKAFQSAIIQLHGNDDNSTILKFRFSGAGQFNKLMQACLSFMFPALRKVLKMPSNMQIAQPMKSKRWKKTRQHIKLYLDTLVKYMALVSSDDVQSVMLKHYHQMSIFVVCFPKMWKPALRLLVKFWSDGLSQPVRILAFLCLARIACNRQNQMLETVLKIMYVTYVRNTRFVSPTTLANISFMRLSLVELFAVDEAAAYQQAFLYIRQLAIHLRNAVRVHKKETLQTVCNWQYVSSLQLWCTLLAKATKSSPLKMLLYPIVEITLGVVQLFSSPQYYPLRFHCAKTLTFISRCSPTFVPVLPLICDVLSSYDFNKKHKHVSMKPLSFACILRVNKHQQLENGFKDAILEQIYSVLLEYLLSQSYSIAFPDLVVPLTNQLNKFQSTCKVAAFAKKLKGLQEKMEENVKFIETARKGRNVNLSNENDVDSWDVFVRSKVSPIDAYYQNWKKAFEEKKSIRQKQNKDFDEKSVPKIKKTAKQSSGGPAELFPSDDEDEPEINFSKGVDDDEEEAPATIVEKKKKRKQVKPVEIKPAAKKQKLAPIEDIEQEDIVEDLDDF